MSAPRAMLGGMSNAACAVCATLSGPGLNWLFVLTQGKIYKRQVNATGVVSAK